MKTPAKKTRTKIENLEEKHGASVRTELGSNELRLVTGGLPMALEPCCCTLCDDVDCD
jgi:hypothetical protein